MIHKVCCFQIYLQQCHHFNFTEQRGSLPMRSMNSARLYLQHWLEAHLFASTEQISPYTSPLWSLARAFSALGCFFRTSFQPKAKLTTVATVARPVKR